VEEASQLMIKFAKMCRDVGYDYPETMKEFNQLAKDIDNVFGPVEDLYAMLSTDIGAGYIAGTIATLCWLREIGVVHDDLTPKNVDLTEFDDEEPILW
jgi:predicted esterase YcpF (UPF0227 family)